MDENQNYPEITDEMQEDELSHSDKAVGILTEPGNTFAEMSKHPPRTIDWLLPLVIFIILVVISQVLQNANPTIAYNAKQKRVEALEKSFDKAIKEGQMTREQADTQLENIEKMNLFVFQIVGIVFTTFLLFFLISAIYLLFGKFVFKGEGSYSSALVANGLPFYIGAIEVLVYTVAALVTETGMANGSVGSFLDILPSTLSGLLLWILNPIAIWMYIVIGIGLARMFKSTKTIPFVILTLIVFLLSNLLAYAFMS
jgi:hypothetical protein